MSRDWQIIVSNLLTKRVDRKYTVERLEENPNVAHIHSSTLVECICETARTVFTILNDVKFCNFLAPYI